MLPFLISKVGAPHWLKARGPPLASHAFTYLKPCLKRVRNGLELELPDLSYTFTQIFTQVQFSALCAWQGESWLAESGDCGLRLLNW